MAKNERTKTLSREVYMIKKLISFIMILSGVFIISGAYAAAPIDCTDLLVCDQETFISVAPDALIVLDVSESMNLNPAGGTKKWGSSTSCVADAASCNSANCADGFCTNSSDDANCTTDCSRLAIAKRALFDLLDDDNNNVIDKADAVSMGIRLGFMRFKNGDDTANAYLSGNILLVKPIATSYQNIFCGASATTGSCAVSDTCSSGECIGSQALGVGGSPLASALNEANTYLAAHQAADSEAGDCRQKFVILLTTSSDTYSCAGDGTECQAQMYTRRRAVVAKAQALADAGYKVFSVGFGQSMPLYLKNTLNWIARWGGTDNPVITNSGNPSAYDPANVASNLCAPATAHVAGDCGGVSIPSWYGEQNDPGYGDPSVETSLNGLAGYAFLAEDAVDLSFSLKAAVATIRDQTYSFTRVSVQTVRTVDENYIYEASFVPLNTEAGELNDPFWLGHLKRYPLNEDGSLAASPDWDAGEILKARTGSTRTIYTYKDGSLINFDSVTAADLGVASAAIRDGVVNFVRNGDTAYDASTTDGAAKDGWKLGDIFHSSPISIGSPSPYFNDIIDANNAYAAYRSANPRTTANGQRLIVAGANDGQFHVFKTSDGSELWSFIPPNLLRKLQSFYHTAHPTSLTHQYFVDGPTTASDIWTGSGDGTAKSSSDWKAYMIISEGRGGGSTLWSSDPSCDSSLSDVYSSTYNQYCGYYAFDVTNTLGSPQYKWHFGGTGGLNATYGAHLGQPWSKITEGRVRISGNEKWVGFASGGYAAADCKTAQDSKCDKRGKGFYVIDLLTGNVLWAFTHLGPDGPTHADMDYSMVAQPASVDYDDDGFIETVYVPDEGGNIWRFKMCEKVDASAGTALQSSACSTSDWTGNIFYDPSSGEIRPIYTKPTVVKSLSGDYWVYFGTGDLNDPTAANAQEKLYGVKDNDRTTRWGLNDLDNISSLEQTYDYTRGPGWYINLSGGGEKMLADPVVYADVVYFTTYTPSHIDDVCEKGGEAKLVAVNYATGAGQFEDGERETSAGSGIASGAVVSENPYGGTNIYVTTSEGAKINAVQPPDPTANKANMQYWHDMRVQ